MANITFTLEEMNEILLSNNRIPHYITDLGIEEQSVFFKIKTGLPLIKSFPLFVKYVSFENEVVTLKMTIKYLKV